MLKVAVVTAFALLIGGCATTSPSVPEDYKGPLATISDSVKSEGRMKAEFFYLSHIGDRTIENSRNKTRLRNQGAGLSMVPVVVKRQVPGTEGTFKIWARTEYAAPILALTNSVYQVSGDVKFSPESGKNYVVKGELGENYSAVWIEEMETNKVMGQKIEVHGSAKLGTFQK